MLTVDDPGFPTSEVGTPTFFKKIAQTAWNLKEIYWDYIMVCRVQWYIYAIYAPVQFVPPTNAQMIFIALSGKCQQEKVEAEGGILLSYQVWFFQIFFPNPNSPLMEAT